jgi:predicted phosphatase
MPWYYIKQWAKKSGLLMEVVSWEVEMYGIATVGSGPSGL